MEFFEKLGETITTAGKEATQKAKDLSEIAKLNLDIRAKEDYVQKQYIELGKIYYKVHRESIDAEGAEHFELIEEALESIEKMKLKIMEIKGTKRCPKCGKELVDEAEYCSFCGVKVSIVVDAEDVEEEDTVDFTKEEE